MDEFNQPFSPKKRGKKMEYSPPKLSSHGALRDLTSGGSGPVQEQKPGPANQPLKFP